MLVCESSIDTNSLSLSSSVLWPFIWSDFLQQGLRLLITLLNYSVQPEERRDGGIFITERYKRSEYLRLTWCAALFSEGWSSVIVLYFTCSISFYYFLVRSVCILLCKETPRVKCLLNSETIFSVRINSPRYCHKRLRLQMESCGDVCVFVCACTLAVFFIKRSAFICI